MSPALGYLHDHPAAIASQTSTRHWPLSLLMEGVAPKTVPEHYLDPRITTALDQDGVGACTAFAVTNIKQLQEFADWGKYLFTSSNALKAYDWLKHGSPDGSYPGDGIPNVEGSYPEQALKLAKVYGYPDKNGKLHKITGYYADPLAGPADWAAIQQVALEHGMLDIGMPWPGNWMTRPAAPLFKMPVPSGAISGHSFAFAAGWDRWLPDPEWWVTNLQSWGPTAANPTGLFRFPVRLLYGPPLGPQIVWKSTDKIDAPFPPPPTPGGTMLTQRDHTARLVETTVGVPLFGPDGTTLITPVLSLPPDKTLASSAGFADTAGTVYFAVLISFRSVPGSAWIKAADCTNVRIQGTDPALLKAAEATGAKAVKEAAIAEAILHGG